jgi:hypothetical protein
MTKTAVANWLKSLSGSKVEVKPSLEEKLLLDSTLSMTQENSALGLLDNSKIIDM